jgi:hypothetical protein
MLHVGLTKSTPPMPIHEAMAAIQNSAKPLPLAKVSQRSETVDVSRNVGVSHL